MSLASASEWFIKWKQNARAATLSRQTDVVVVVSRDDAGTKILAAGQELLVVER